MVALRNHGKCSNATSSSSSPSKIQKPCRETFVTSATEVAGPGITDLLFVTYNEVYNVTELASGQSGGARHGNVRLQPDVRFAVRMRNVHVQPRFFSREKEESVRTFTEDGRRHV
jgi:hypothetical protein